MQAWLCRTRAVAGGEVAALAPAGRDKARAPVRSHERAVNTQGRSTTERRLRRASRCVPACRGGRAPARETPRARAGAHELRNHAVERGALEVQRLAHLADALLAWLVKQCVSTACAQAHGLLCLCDRPFEHERAGCAHRCTAHGSSPPSVPQRARHGTRISTAHRAAGARASASRRRAMATDARRGSVPWAPRRHAAPSRCGCGAARRGASRVSRRCR